MNEIVGKKNTENSVYQRIIKSRMTDIRNNAAPLRSMFEISQYLNGFGCKLNQKQRDAVRFLTKGGIGIITGGPDTGKSTVIRNIVEASGLCEQQVLVLATTEIDAINIENAQTIYQALGICSDDDEWSKDRPINQQLIIIDDFSRISTKLFARLLMKLKDDIMLILVGDENQIGSIEVGRLLKDFYNENSLNYVRMTETYNHKVDC